MELFYAAPHQISDSVITLDEFESRHLIQTLKKKPGDTITITDGQGNVYQASIKQSGKKVPLQIIAKEHTARDNWHLTLAIGFIRPNRLDTLIEKCTELGVDQFILFRSRYSNYASLNSERYIKIMRQAIKQSQRYYLPELQIKSDLEQLFTQCSSFDHKLMALSARAPALLGRMKTWDASVKKSILMVVGPEGGFSDEEVDAFINHGFETVALAASRLRTETAAMSSIAIIQSYYHHLKEAEFGTG